MPTPREIIQKAAIAVSAAVALFAGSPASAEIVGRLETPRGSAAGIGSVQGWVYTDTPGASLIQPFDVFVDGVKIMSVPCCSDRGDVRDAFPGAPLRTGFSGTTNWAREVGRDPVDVEVVVRDTAGGEIVLRSERVVIHAMTSMPFSAAAAWTDWEEAQLIPAAPSPMDAGPPSWCALSNSALAGPAELVCMGLTSTGFDGTSESCDGGVRYTWDRAAQGFRQTSSCQAVEPWIDHEDGTATDTRTSLMWEVKTAADDVFHHAWSADARAVPNGDAFFAKVGTANGAAGGCRAGYCDWRLPTAEELATILDVRACAGPLDPCTTIPGHTAPGEYWSVTTSFEESGKAFVVDFAGADLLAVPKTHFRRVRLVRGAIPKMLPIPLLGDSRRRVIDGDPRLIDRVELVEVR